MTARAKRRSDARAASKVMERSGAGEMDTVSELASSRRMVESLTGYCKDYRMRLERIAMGLQFVQNRVIEGNTQAATIAIRALMSNDAAEARETVGNRRMALEMAVAVLRRHDRARDISDALDKIKMIAPEAFGADAVEMEQTRGRA